MTEGSTFRAQFIKKLSELGTSYTSHVITNNVLFRAPTIGGDVRIAFNSEQAVSEGNNKGVNINGIQILQSVKGSLHLVVLNASLTEDDDPVNLYPSVTQIKAAQDALGRSVLAYNTIVYETAPIDLSYPELVEEKLILYAVAENSQPQKLYKDYSGIFKLTINRPLEDVAGTSRLGAAWKLLFLVFLLFAILLK